MLSAFTASVDARLRSPQKMARDTIDHAHQIVAGFIVCVFQGTEPMSFYIFYSQLPVNQLPTTIHVVTRQGYICVRVCGGSSYTSGCVLCKFKLNANTCHKIHTY